MCAVWPQNWCSSPVNQVYLLTFPRLLGAVFNPCRFMWPVTVPGKIFFIFMRYVTPLRYACLCRQTAPVRWATLCRQNFPCVAIFSGCWWLSSEDQVNDQTISLVMRYLIDNEPALTATLRGHAALPGASFFDCCGGEAITLQADCRDTF